MLQEDFKWLCFSLIMILVYDLKIRQNWQILCSFVFMSAIVTLLVTNLFHHHHVAVTNLMKPHLRYITSVPCIQKIQLCLIKEREYLKIFYFYYSTLWCLCHFCPKGSPEPKEVRAHYSCFSVMITITKSNCQNENVKGKIHPMRMKILSSIVSKKQTNIKLLHTACLV